MHHRRFQRLCGALPLLLLAIPGGSRSQDISKQVPVNAQAKLYGTGWECKRGFRQDGVACIAIKLPENAYLSETSYESGWECKRGYKRDGNSCVGVKVPQNAYLSGSTYGGDDWECERGYRKTGAGCISVIVPKNGYLTDSFSFQDRGWNCDRGFRASGNECVAVKVPQNAYLSDSLLTSGWECERGFHQSGDTCLPMEIPRNGYLDTFGRDWKCERGFKKANRDCVSVKLPTTLILIISGTAGVVTGHFEDKTIVACCRSEAPTAPTRETDRPWGKKATMDMDRFFNDQNLERLRSLASIATTEAEQNSSA
jgi:hypothetical protein